jgi:hypothetical protein
VVALNLTDPNGTGQSAPIDLELQAAADTLLCPGCATGTGLPRVLCFNGDDALALQKKNGNNWVNVDIFGCIGERPSNSQGTYSPTAGWTILAPFSSMPANYDPATQGPYFLQYWSQDKTLLRKFFVQTGVSVNPAQQTFNPSVQWDSLPANTFYELGRHACACGCTEFVNAVASIALSSPSTCADGTVTATASATGIQGDNNLTYSWSNGATTAVTQLSVGTHTVTIGRADGCSIQKTVEVTLSPAPTIVPVVVSPSACGLSNGSINLNITGSSGPYQITWSTGSTGALLNSLSAGNYTYQVTDALQCSYADVVSVSDVGAATVTLDSLVLASCDTCSDGALYVSINVGSGAAYSWTFDGDSVASTQDATGLSIGEYQLTVTFNGCVSSFSAYVGYPAGLQQVEQNEWMHLFPNPASSLLTFNSTNPMSSIELFDISGKSIGFFKTMNSLVHTQDISTLQPGIYFAKVLDATNRTSVKKFIKQ